MLKHKTARNPSPSHLQDFDLNRFKEAMKKEMEGDKYKRYPLPHIILNRNQAKVITDCSYEEIYTHYIKEIFNSSVVMLINRLCIESKSCPDDIRNNYPLHSLLVKTSKELLLNQLELVYLSLYLDNFGWKNTSFDIMDNFLIVALSVKKYLNSNTDTIEKYLSEEYPDLIGKFNMWLRQQREFHSNIVLSPRVVNERFNLLNKPYNTFCKNNFIDYNESVDKILQMSLPYNESARQVNGGHEGGEGEESDGSEEKKEEGHKKQEAIKVKGTKQRRRSANAEDEEEKEEDIDIDDDDDSESESEGDRGGKMNQFPAGSNNRPINPRPMEVIENLMKEQQDDNIEADIPMFTGNDNPHDNNSFSVGHLESVKHTTYAQEIRPSPFIVKQIQASAFLPLKNSTHTINPPNPNSLPAKLFTVKEPKTSLSIPKTKSVFNLNLATPK